MGAPLGLGFYRESLENQENPISCKGTKQSVPARRGCGIAKREDRREVDHLCSLEWGGEVPRCPTGCEFPARGADPLGTNCPSLRWDPPFFTNCRQKVPHFSPFFSRVWRRLGELPCGGASIFASLSSAAPDLFNECLIE